MIYLFFSFLCWSLLFLWLDTREIHPRLTDIETSFNLNFPLPWISNLEHSAWTAEKSLFKMYGTHSKFSSFGISSLCGLPVIEMFLFVTTSCNQIWHVSLQNSRCLMKICIFVILYLKKQQGCRYVSMFSEWKDRKTALQSPGFVSKTNILLRFVSSMIFFSQTSFNKSRILSESAETSVYLCLYENLTPLVSLGSFANVFLTSVLP